MIFSNNTLSSEKIGSSIFLFYFFYQHGHTALSAAGNADVVRRLLLGGADLRIADHVSRHKNRVTSWVRKNGAQ